MNSLLPYVPGILLMLMGVLIAWMFATVVGLVILAMGLLYILVYKLAR